MIKVTPKMNKNQYFLQYVPLSFSLLFKINHILARYQYNFICQD